MSAFNELSVQIISSLSGGVVGGFAGFVAGVIQDRKARQERLRNIASALIGEIGVLSRRFETQYLEILRVDFQSSDLRVLQPFHHVRGEQDYTPIFRALGGDIGCLPAPLPYDLVSWYTSLASGQERAKSMHDLAIQGDPRLIDQISTLAAVQHKAFTQLIEDASALINQLSKL